MVLSTAECPASLALFCVDQIGFDYIKHGSGRALFLSLKRRISTLHNTRCLLARYFSSRFQPHSRDVPKNHASGPSMLVSVLIYPRSPARPECSHTEAAQTS